jgi:tetratricopeptide (TPR) repeat protein
MIDENTGHMTRMHFFMVLCTFLMCNVAWDAFSQHNDDVLMLKGLLEEGHDPLSGVYVTIDQDNKTLRTTTTDEKGLFTLDMNLHSIYTISFKKEDYVTKKIYVNSSLPEGEGGEWQVEFSMGLFEMYPGLDVSALEYPVTKIIFKEDENGFGYDEHYTAKMMAKVEKILAQLQRLKEEDYRRLIRKGDHHFDRKAYQSSITFYQKALDQRPDDRYPKKQIERARKLLKKHQKRQTFYENAISRADALYDAEKYEKAREIYYEALSYDRSASYPKQQIEKIEENLRRMKAERKTRQYQDIIKQADKAFDNENFDAARSSYQKALTVKPDKQHPNERLKRIEAIVQKRTRESNVYNRLIRQADSSFTESAYANAKTRYSEALFIKPANAYPRDQISKIDDILEEISAREKREKLLNDKYRDAINTADQLFENGAYEDARVAYNQASKVKPGASYPQKKISTIDQILQKRRENKEKNDQGYREAVSEADQSMEQKNYEAALQHYHQALAFKPEKSYPRSQIEKINNVLSQLEKEKQEQERKNQRYTQAINDADKCFRDKAYYDAKVNYEKALGYKPDELYPKKQLEKIEKTWEALEDTKKKNAAKPQQLDHTSGDEPPVLEFASEAERKNYLNQLSGEYPRGITVEYYNLKKRKIKRVIVNHNGVAKDYRRVKHSWGGVFYFRNGQSISKAVFNVETKDRD